MALLPFFFLSCITSIQTCGLRYSWTHTNKHLRNTYMESLLLVLNVTGTSHCHHQISYQHSLWMPGYHTGICIKNPKTVLICDIFWAYVTHCYRTWFSHATSCQCNVSQHCVVTVFHKSNHSDHLKSRKTAWTESKKVHTPYPERRKSKGNKGFMIAC